MSLRNYDLRLPAEEMGFIGLKNYIDILTDHEFWDALIRTVFMVVICVSLQFLLGFILALLLNRYFTGRGFIRAVSMIPWVVPGVLAGLIWRWMYDGNYGVLNDILVKIGILDKFVPFLSQSQTSLWAVCVTYIWQGIPFFLLMILAGLQSVPADTYEASRIDGANFFQSLFYVTIPSIKNTISITVMLRVIWVANSVDIIYNMTEG
ncbi:MAG TPA: sugar ABC transporter permease, partial [Candidatus Blautia faecipullorum]|nr:sugar ABC transporter permease [Candidatus Blautia faecipullorum]